MYEHATLQEAYTGALIAGKGKALNNINTIMERSKVKTEDWARVRFGAGTPWRRCWCVISPPDEKEVQRLQKLANKKKSAYDRSRPPVLKGDIKFYDSKKTKKVRPIATISDAYSAFAIYPQSKPLIDASTLVKVEGSITIHSNPPSTTEGFVFVMPEVHPAVTGFEMMLRWLFPVFDTFALYGRPGRLIADTADPNSLMFAMPKHRRYGYLEILDVTGLILEQGSANWRESEWRKRMKDLTKKRMTAIENGSRTNSRYSSRRSTRNSFGPSRSRIQFDDAASIRSSPSVNWGPAAPADPSFDGLPRTNSTPPGGNSFTPPRASSNPHQRSVSETNGADRFQNQNSGSNYDGAYEPAPTPPPHNIGIASGREAPGLRHMKEMASTPERVSSEDEQARVTPVRELQELQATTSPEPVATPPAFSHAPGSMPSSKPYHSPELRRANSRMSNATLSQLAGAGGVAAAYHASEDERRLNEGRYSEERGQRGVLPAANANEYPANEDGLNEGLVTANPRFSFEQSSPSRPPNFDTPTNYSQPPPQFPFSAPHNLPPSSQIAAGRSVPQIGVQRDSSPNSRMYEPPQVFASSDSNYQTRSQQGPTVQGHSSQPSADSTHSTGSQPSRLQTSQTILRKALPTRKESLQTPTSAETPSSTGSLGQHVLDQAAFDMIGRDDRKLTPLPETQIHRQNSGVSSIYDDTASTVSPDYASTRRSIDTQKSIEKPRAGVMKTVGNADDSREHGDKSPIQIDFGPTLNYASDRLPIRSQSPGPTQGYVSGQGPRYRSPGRGTGAVAPGVGPAMNNYPADRAPRQRSPANRPGSSGNSTNPKPAPPENAHYRNSSAESRTLAWQPGMSAIGVASSQQAITPEQFVAQRAAATPLYAHQRQTSGNAIRANTPTPPLPRNRSSDFLAQQGHSRQSSAELLQRPNSRGASGSLGPSGTGDIASNLSAREQEHIARVTGQPLINMAQNNNRQAPGSGLVGAIEAREKEKQQMKQGINSQAVQQAIAQRQQHSQQQGQYQMYPEELPTEYRTSTPYGSTGMANMGQYPQQFPVQGQRQQAWVSPAANVFAQGGGWSAPSPGYAVSPNQGIQSPSQQYPPQQQYFPNQQQQQQGGQGQGRGNAGYHGHAF
jgi:CCR4-NOT transcriptional complex subunit CAF120